MIDEIDIKLMQELQKDGRATHVELARKLNVVEGTVRRRIKKLVRNGVMKIVAVPNLYELGYSFVGFIAIQVQMARMREIAEELAQTPNVCYLAFVTGRYDMIAIVLTRSPQELSTFIRSKISAIPNIIRTETWVDLAIMKGDWSAMDTSQLLTSIEPSQFQE